jgi:predicted PurR-regulated permease PerM
MEGTWLPPLRLTLVLVVLIVGGWLLWQATPLIEALIIAALLAILLNPAVGFLARRTPLRRPAAAALVYALTMVFLAGLPALAGTLAVGYAEDLTRLLREAEGALRQTLSRPVLVFGFPLFPENALDYVEQVAATALAAIPGGSLNLLGGVTTNLLWGLVVAVSLYYFLKDGPLLRPWLEALFPQGLREDLHGLLDEIQYLWGDFIRVQMLIFLILAGLSALGTLGVALLFQSGLLPFSVLSLAVSLLLLYTLVQQVDNLWLRPRWLGRRMQLHPGVSIVALLGALALSGVLGALLIIPALATGKLVARFIRRRWGPPAEIAEPDPAAPAEENGGAELQVQVGQVAGDIRADVE